MKRTSLFFLMAACLFSAVAATHKVHFDSSRRKSGAKIAIRDINPSLPTDWTPYRYVGVELRVTAFPSGIHHRPWL